MHKQNVFRGLSATTSFLLIAALFGTELAGSYTTEINKFFNTSSTEVVSTGEADDTDTTYYPTGLSSDDTSSAEAVGELEKMAVDENIRQEEEGAVLLSNNNNALPLAEGSNITLLGSSLVNIDYSRLDSNDFGEVYEAWENDYEGYDATITYVEAFSKVYNVNQVLVDAYTSSKDQYPGRGMQTDANGNVVDAEAPASFYTDDLTGTFSEYGDAAVIVLTRHADEGSDFSQTGGVDGTSALALQPNEIDLLAMVQSYKDEGVFGSVIVLLNSANAMEIEALEDYGVDAVLWIGLPGSAGMTGVVNVISGDVSPSGHLTDTYATSSLSAPAVVNAVDSSGYWSNADEILDYVGYTTEDYSGEQNYTSYLVQAEGIYVGYRYYETRYEDLILGQGNADSAAGVYAGESSWDYNAEVTYPFGYGLSYTTFEQNLDGVSYNEATDKYEVQVTVTNTGDTYSGKSVVQIYAQTPYGDYEKENNVEKASVQLAGFAKTEELAPGESATVTVEVERYFLASYDSEGAEGYILSVGDYYLAVGNDAHDALNNILAAKGATGMTDTLGNETDGNADNVYTWNQAELDTETYNMSRVNEDVEVTNAFETAELDYWLGEDTVTYLSRSDWEGTYPQDYSELTLTATEEMMAELLGAYEQPADAPDISDFTQGEDSGLSFIAMKDVAFDDEETWDLFLNQFTVDELLNMINCNSGAIERLGVPAATQIDDNIGIYNTFLAVEGVGQHWVCEPITAATFNVERFEARGELLGLEAEFSGQNEIFYGGGNTHRTQYCGRNQQYYSEDAILGYYVGSYEAQGMQGVGVTYCIKHFAANNQETNRESIATFFSEQAFREVELRSFEGSIVEGGALSVMDSFNRLGLTFASYSYSLNTTILRNEWGFKGHVTTDAIAGSLYKQQWGSSLTAGVDFYCFNNFIAAFGSSFPDALEAIGNYVDAGDGYILGCLREAAKRDIYALLHTYRSNGLSSTTQIVAVTPWWQSAINVVDVVIGIATAASLILFVAVSLKNKKEVA